MSTYLMSDLHGDYKNFRKMLLLTNFRSDDVLYILGDVVDRGKDSLKLLEFVRTYSNIVVLKGNHEMFLERYLKGTFEERIFSHFGGDTTLVELQKYSREQKDELADYLEKMPYYQEITTEHGSTILTHSGIHLDYLVEDEDGKIDVVKSIQKAAAENEWDFLIGNDLMEASADIWRRLNRYMIVGHTPVQNWQDGDYHMLHKRFFMDIDCGAGHRENGGRMGCYRVEDGMEFYC